MDNLDRKGFNARLEICERDILEHREVIQMLIFELSRYQTLVISLCDELGAKGVIDAQEVKNKAEKMLGEIIEAMKPKPPVSGEETKGGLSA